MKQTKTKQKELLESQTSVEESTHKEDSSNKIAVEYTKIKGTPFQAARRNEEWHLIMGTYKINKEPLTSIEDVYAYMEEEKWNIIVQMTWIIATDQIKEDKRNKDTNKP